MDINRSNSHTTTVRETVMRQSFVFSGANPNNSNRSFISTSLVNDSYAFGDDLRKYLFYNLDLESKTSPTIRRPIWEKIFNSLWSFKLLKLKDYLMKLKS